MIGWVRPQILIPAHGEPLHLAEHAELARRVGVPRVIVCNNGDLVRLGPGRADIVDEIPAGRLYKDGLIMIDAQSRTVADRRRLSFGGIVSVSLAVSEEGQLVSDLEIDLTGIPETNRAGKSIAQLVYDAVSEGFEAMPRAKRRDPEAVEEAMRRTVRAVVAQNWGKKTTCHVHVLTV